MYFVGCGISRLARYNVTAPSQMASGGKVTHFEGFPIPTSLMLVTFLAVLFGIGKSAGDLPFGAVVIGPAVFHPLALLYVLHGSAMISKTLRIPKP